MEEPLQDPDYEAKVALLDGGWDGLTPEQGKVMMSQLFGSLIGVTPLDVLRVAVKVAREAATQGEATPEEPAD